MTSRTHDLTALTALDLVLISHPLPQISLTTGVVSLGACFLGSLLPDIDEPSSEFWQRIPVGRFFGELTHQFIGSHRHLTHSLLGLIIVGIGLKYLLFLLSPTFLINMTIVWLAFMIGFVSHLLADCFTKEGIPLFFPIHWNIGFPPLKELRIKTGGRIEKFIVFPILLFGNIYLFYHHHQIYLNLIKMFLEKG